MDNLEIFNFYISNLMNFKERYKRQLMDSTTFAAVVYNNLRWYQNMIDYSKVSEKIIIEDNVFLDDFCQETDFRPRDYLYTIEYRGVQVHVFLDDYGQQEVACFKIKDEMHTAFGGAFNIVDVKDFCMSVDAQIEYAYVIQNSLDEEELRCIMM